MIIPSTVLHSFPLSYTACRTTPDYDKTESLSKLLHGPEFEFYRKFHKNIINLTIIFLRRICTFSDQTFIEQKPLNELYLNYIVL